GTPCTDDTPTDCQLAACNSGSCIQAYSPAPTASPCPDLDDNDCTAAYCDGSGSCNQVGVLSGLGSPCNSSTNSDCDKPDTCDGAGTCLLNLVAPGNACGDGVCNQCDGVGSCVDSPTSSPGPGCNGGETECSDADTCGPGGICNPNDKPSSTACASDNNSCT